MIRFLARGIAILLVLLAGAATWFYTPDLPRAKLEAAYLRHPGDLVWINGTHLHLRDEGPPAAPAIILLHGLGSSLHTFDGWAAALSARYRVIRFDLPGAGLSGPDPDSLYTNERSIALLCAVLDRLELESATLAGNSIGGRLAWRFAAVHPDRVDRLILIAPDGYASPGFSYGTAPELPLMLNLIRCFLPRWALRPSIAAAYGDPARLSEPVLERYHALLLASGNRKAMLDRMRHTVLVDPRPLLRRIPVPVLLMWGEKDAMIPVANARDYLAELPDARLVVLPGLGHVPQEEAPAESLVPVIEFLDG
ncbi:alpha/beta fold hydrolase [Tabrizicola sp. YIM 78059]|uniref:alpha/beta fold hydrolase n=1 Tax=Tabrizicola sp. YIM 78059 TaxID=2529861 RepID=UPI0020BF3DE0|nr:alpha/beta hydrolase [Tabrizicola sp. YIM 78059]